MFEGKYGKALTIGLVILVLLVLGVLGYFIVDYVRSSQDSQTAANAAEQFDGQVTKNEDSKKNTVATDNTNVAAQNVTLNVQTENITVTTPTTSTSGSSTKTYKGFVTVGTIAIPKIDLNLPVLKEASAKAIDVSVAINAGPGLNKVGNTVIIGHNYRDGRFFANLKNLVIGDKVYITDETGTKLEYTVYNIYITAPEDSDFMDRETNGNKEITLDTCTDDTQSRLIIWAKAN